MQDFLAKCRQLARTDIKSLSKQLSSLRLSREVWLDILEHLYLLIGLLALIFLIWAGSIAFWPAASSEESTTANSYSFYQLPSDRLRALSSFDTRGMEGKDPLWLELRTFLDFVAINARPDNPGGAMARFRWMNQTQELKVPVGQIHYFGPSGGQWSRVDKSSGKVAFKVLKVELLDQSITAQLEILRPKEGKWQSVETITLMREVAKKSSDTAVLQALTRAGCRWYGPDLFLANHAGSSSQQLAMTQRLEIGPISKQNALYLSPGMALVQQGKDFIITPLGSATQGQPIWVVDEIKNDKLQVIAWNSAGDQMLPLNLARQQESWQPKLLESQIQLAGVRSQDQLLIQIQQERWSLKVLDWLLHTQKAWTKIRSPEQVDQYVSGGLKGELLILKGMRQDSGGNWLALFRLYSPARSQVYDFELKAGLTASPQVPAADGPTSEQLRDPTSHFVPIQGREAEAPKWPADEERAWQPPSEISPEKMLEILRNLSESPDQDSSQRESKPKSPFNRHEPPAPMNPAPAPAQKPAGAEASPAPAPASNN